MVGKKKVGRPKKHPGGRPPKFATPEAFEKKVEEYFESGYRTRTVTLKGGETIEVPLITLTGLCLYLGFADKCSFYAYEKKPEFAHSVKRARSFIEREYEEQLKSGNPTAAIFALKNFGWTDKQEVDMKSTDGSMSPPREIVIRPYDKAKDG